MYLINVFECIWIVNIFQLSIKPVLIKLCSNPSTLLKHVKHWKLNVEGYRIKLKKKLSLNTEVSLLTVEEFEGSILVPNFRYR